MIIAKNKRHETDDNAKIYKINNINDHNNKKTHTKELNVLSYI